MKQDKFWRSIDELNHFEAFQASLENEFAPDVFPGHDIGRRDFLALMPAVAALASLASCTPTVPEKIIPYVRAPEEIVPGKPLFFATAFPMNGYGLGILAESHMGRPVKVEGNPDHPASMGSTDAFAQASVLTLYDPDRSKVITQAGGITTWDAFITALAAELETKRLDQGKGLRILTETLTSPTLAAQMKQILKQFPSARWHQYEPINADAARAGTRAVLGRDADVVYHFDKAGVILSLDADFLLLMPDHVRHARDFASRRRAKPGENPMNRLYVVESTPSITGASADHRRAARPSEVEQIAIRIQQAIEGKAQTGDPWTDAIVRDLLANRGTSIVVAGMEQSPMVHSIAHALNAMLGNAGKTIEYIEPVAADPVPQVESLKDLTGAMQSGAVDLLLIIGGNPVYTAPADLEFSKHLKNVRLRVRFGSYEDETSEMCHWHIPETHYLESWGDIRSPGGRTTIMQPLINPLYDGKSMHEFLSAVLGQPTRTTYEILREAWNLDEKAWRRAVHDGVLEEVKPVNLIPYPAPPLPLEEAGRQRRSGEGQVELVFRPDPTVFDGRFSNNAWLQELPKPLTRIVWDNVALLSPATANRLNLANEDVIEIQSENRAVKAPVWISPGHADDTVTVFLGYGRTRAGKAGTGRGYNAYSIRTSSSPWIIRNVEIRKTGERYPLVTTQVHHSMENRRLVRRASVTEYGEKPHFAAEEGEAPPRSLTLYPEFPPQDYAWGMAIDLSACIGCSACVIACQAENNIPAVGKIEAGRSREMHWLRIDRYYQGDLSNPEMLFQPVLCMHCENAPCEPVCPVAATTHSNEGLNEMTYNRCVGTRYCSNNCPYKVRRFNFFDFHANEAPAMAMLYNPDVTVRSRGVMEKCTYCVQRINHARIQAKDEDRTIRDGEVVTACQAACPADAIVFGNINDPESRVSKLKAEPRNYSLLADLNTRPRTTYLARLLNPNPEAMKK